MLKYGCVECPLKILMGDGCSDCIGGHRDLGVNGVECEALSLGSSPVDSVSFHIVVARCVLYAERG